MTDSHDPDNTPAAPEPVVARNFRRAGTDAALSSRLADEFVAWVKTLASAAVYATLIVTFGFQVARVDGQSMSPTLENHDRLIVNKFAYLTPIGEPQVGDIVMLSYRTIRSSPSSSAVIATENQTVRMVDGKVFVNDVPVDDSFVPLEIAGTTTTARWSSRRVLLRDGRSPHGQLRQPPLGLCPQEVHHGPRAGALVAGA